MKLNKKVLIFDWDGTLMNSADTIVSCVQQTAENNYLSIPLAENIRKGIGLSTITQLHSLFPNLGEEEYNQIRKQYDACIIQRMKDNTPQLFPDAIYTLSKLIQNNISLAIATSMRSLKLSILLDKLQINKLFSSIKTADLTAPKPDPQMIEEILVELDCSKENALMVGDTTYDIMMANNAGIQSAAITTGVHIKDELLSANPTFCIDKLSELVELIHID